MERLWNEIRGGEKHIGCSQTGIYFDSPKDDKIIDAISNCDKLKIETVQLEYCRFHGGFFEKFLKALQGAKNVTKMYFTHDASLPAKDIVDFVVSNNIFLKELNLDTTDVSVKEICNIIRLGRVECLNYGSSMGRSEGDLQMLRDAAKGQKCIINTERLLPNLDRYHQTLASKNEEQREARLVLENLVHDIDRNNANAMQQGAKKDYSRCAKA